MYLLCATTDLCQKWTSERAIPAIEYRLNFDLGKKNKIHHHNWKEHVKISKIAKFGREML
jgi:hypothetical protein